MTKGIIITVIIGVSAVILAFGLWCCLKIGSKGD